MFRNILIGTVLTVVAASTSLSPAIAKSIPLNYADPCKTALENFEQADWERTHRTTQGNLGGAEGWNELADSNEKSADHQRALEGEYSAEALKNPPGPGRDYWNKQAADANRNALEDDNRAEEYRAQARKMRHEALDYEVAARKALQECKERLNAKRAAQILLGIDDIMTNSKPLSEGSNHAETDKTPSKKPVRKTKTEKKPKPTKVKKPASVSQTAARSIARDVAVSVATQLIFGEISGMGLNKKHHKLDRHQMMEGQAMGEGKSRRKMKRNKLMSTF